MKKREINLEVQKLCSKFAETHPIPTNSIDWAIAQQEIGDQLPKALEVGEKQVEQSVTKPDGTKSTVVSVEPVFEKFDAFARANREDILNSLQRAYAEQKPKKLEIPHRPDISKFFSAMKTLFPNVRDVAQATASIVEWTSSFRDKRLQKCLYLVSQKSGGTGKTFMTQLFSDYIESLGGKTKSTRLSNSTYLNPHDFSANMVVLQDLRTHSIDIELLNCLIDHTTVDYNIKFGPKGQFVNEAQLVITSNYRPQNINTRRWAEIEYLSYNMENRPYDLAVLNNAVKDMFECAPGMEWRLKNADKLAPQAPAAVNYDVLQFIVEHGPTAEKCRPTEFFSGEPHMMVDQCKNMFIDWQSKHIFPTKWAATKFELKIFDWQKIAKFIDDSGMLDELDDECDPLESCAKQWDELAAKFADDSTPPESPTPPEPEKKTVSYKEFVDTALQHFSDASHESSSLDAPLVTNCVRLDGSKSRLHDTTDTVRPVVMAFESDAMTLNEQEANIKQPIWSAKVFSGNKSLHVQVRIPDEISKKLSAEPHRVETYHAMYKQVASMLFHDTSRLDMQCKSWIRKFRNPDGMRPLADGKAVVQAATYNDNMKPIPWNSILSWCKEIVAKQYAAPAPHVHLEQTRDMTKDRKVSHYLSTPYLKLKGNGDSDSSLYCAIKRCMQYNDMKTLEAVKAKALSERWTYKDLNRKEKQALAFLAKKFA